MPTVATAHPITFQLLPSTTVRTLPASTQASAGQVFNPTYGFRISDPMELPGDPVTASVLRFETHEPAGTRCTVLTSINYGASWDIANPNEPVPRLFPGDATTRAVMTKVIMTRLNSATPKPALKYMELIVTCDSGVYEWISVGYGVIDKPAGSSGPHGSSGAGGGPGVTARGGGQHGGGPSVRVHCTDTSSLIRDAAWEQPYTVPAGMNYGDAIRAMILDRLPGHDRFRMVSTSRLVPSQLIYGLDSGGDPWKDIQELAQAIGYEVFFDPNDVLVFRPVADPRYAVPVLTIDQSANPVITDVKSELDLKTVVNYVVVRGENTSSRNPVAAFAYDNDPLSLTYVGKIGRRTKKYTFPLIKTVEDAQAAANAILYNSLGATNNVTLTMMPHSCLEQGDAIRVNVPDVKVNGIYVIRQILPMPVSPNDPMRLVCYRQTSNTTTSIITG